jgi:hypothetical protein
MAHTPEPHQPPTTLEKTMMTSNSPYAAQVREEIEQLIQAASHSQFEILDRIYHEDMRTYLFDEDRTLHLSDKAGFKKHVIEGTKKAANPSTWAEFHLVEADQDQGHVLISRKVNLTGTEQIVTLSIDLVHQDGRWQITREVIFVRKDK